MARKRRNEILSKPVIASAQQPGTGCMYHSFVALTGEKNMLQFDSDNCPARFHIRVMDAGYLLLPVYCNGFQAAKACSFWPQYFALCKRGAISEKRLLITCDGMGVTPSIHVIGVRLDFRSGLVTVADPMSPGLPVMTFAAFEESECAQKTVEILALDSAVLDDYPAIAPIA